MGFSVRKRIKVGDRGAINVSRSGLSGSYKVGPFTFNTRGKNSVRLGKGVSFKF